MQDGEGQALAKGRARGAYLATSLVDGLAPADFFASLGRLMTGDPNLAVTAVKFVSAV